MSIDPVHSSPPAIEHSTPEKKPHPVAFSRSNDAASNVKLEIAKRVNVPLPSAIPEHEVKVVLDTPDNNTLVYQVLDKKSGDVVLQVPSADQLRGIHESQELLQRIEERARPARSDEAAQQAVPGRDQNGHKL
jgi:hypothetical protein